MAYYGSNYFNLLCSSEGGVEDAFVFKESNALDFVVVKWEFARQRAIQTCFKESSPSVFEHQLAS